MDLCHQIHYNPSRCAYAPQVNLKVCRRKKLPNTEKKGFHKLSLQQPKHFLSFRYKAWEACLSGHTRSKRKTFFLFSFTQWDHWQLSECSEGVLNFKKLTERIKELEKLHPISLYSNYSYKLMHNYNKYTTS